MNIIDSTINVPHRKETREINLIPLVFVALLVLLVPIVRLLGLCSASGLSKVTFAINLFLCCFAIVLEKNRTFSLYKVTLYFVLIFFILSPLSQIYGSYSPWGFAFEDNLIVRSNILIMLFLCIFVVVKCFGPNHRIRETSNKTPVGSKTTDVVLLVLFVFIIASIQLFIGFQNVFIRHGFEFNRGTIFDIAIDYFLKAFPCFYYCYLKSSKKNKAFALIVLLLALLINNPVANNRFLALSAYCGLLCVTFTKLGKNGIFDLLLVVGIVIIYPLFSQFKFFNTTNTFSLTIDLSSVFNAVDYDAYSMLCQTIRYVDAHGVLYGKQIISSIFFFVPRAILPIKGINSGEVVVTYFYPSAYSNVSCPLIGEGLIDFGVAGVILYSFLFALITCSIDKRACKSKNGITSKLYFFLFGYWIFILRGSLAPTVLRLFGFLLPFIVYYCIIFLGNVIRKRDA